MAAVLKTARGRELPRGFESHTLRWLTDLHNLTEGVRWSAGGVRETYAQRTHPVTNLQLTLVGIVSSAA